MSLLGVIDPSVLSLPDVPCCLQSAKYKANSTPAIVISSKRHPAKRHTLSENPQQLFFRPGRPTAVTTAAAEAVVVVAAVVSFDAIKTS